MPPSLSSRFARGLSSRLLRILVGFSEMKWGLAVTKPVLVLYCLSLGGACSGCGADAAEARTVALTFEAHVAGVTTLCEAAHVVGSEQQEARVADARLYVSEIELRDANGDWVHLELDDGRESPLKSGFVSGFTLTDEERADLVAFLASLTDESFVDDPRFADPFAPERQ